MATDYTRFTEIAQVFTPGTPVRRLDLFAGRRTQLLDLASVIGHPGQHAVIYGERGVGKTSLANIISDAIQESSNVAFWRVTCSRADTFESIWARLLKEYTDETLYGDTVPGPDKVRLILQRQGLLVVVLDELDQIDDPITMAHMADTVKALSDHAVDTTLIFVGVADSIDELLEEHESVERALMQIQMPRMSPPELVEAIDKRLEVLSMTMTDDAKRRIAILSEGLPYYTHTLALYAAQEAAADHRNAVTLLDVGNATKKAVEKAQHSIRGAYLGAVGSPRKETLFPQVLLACALAPKNELGYFRQADIQKPMSIMRGKPTEISVFAQHLDKLTHENRAAVLEKSGRPWHWTFRFTNPLLQPYVILRALSTELQGPGVGLLTEDQLAKFQPETLF